MFSKYVKPIVKVLTKVINIDSGFVMPFYAVRRGRKPGLYMTWDECKKQVDGFVKARYKKFDTEREAWAFVRGNDNPGYIAPLHGQGVTNVSQFGGSGTQFFSQQGPSGVQQSPQKTPKKIGSESDIDFGTVSPEIQIKVKEMEVGTLRQKLKMNEEKVKYMKKKAELQDLKKSVLNSPAKVLNSPVYAKGKASNLKSANKSFTKGARSAPYQSSSSASWKQNRTTQYVETVPSRKFHTETSPVSNSTGGAVAEVYTDGACSNNGKGNPQAGIGVYWGPNHAGNLSERLEGRQTNNRAEIHAVVRAVQYAKTRGIQELTVHTDSQFLINSMTKWLPSWLKKDWKTSTGAPVINREDFEALIHHSKGIKIHWNHVRGHQGIHGNEEADKLAVAGANKPYVWGDECS
ncbi:ribonuclease H1-like isoform X2 [Dreissena polymorpha]|nr:ribonuclease H1-like isoform X2 [Dreissena polymorpha]